ncbi:putative fatty acid desaturase [Rosellinia necatrix]|uniref:Delta 8-(E)-sphingolipid desaturase n=1 Tax=Rosellinia necatrix TaxID=77044 RepID=A0A1W2TVQ8_ROSNE|nr:putative fatty acid desaturase [Rosellinia necatrix]
MGSSRDQILAPRAIKRMIADGHTIVIFDDFVLRLDSWLGKHPGGRLAILHMIGKDATDEMTVYHSAATLKTMQAFRIGRKPPGPWTNLTPPIRGGVYQKQEEVVAKTDAAAWGIVEDTPPTSEDSMDDEEKAALSSNLRRRAPTRKASLVRDPVPAKPANIDQTASEYVDRAVQQEINQDLQIYPSLDASVQLSITQKYRALHQKIRDQGLYTCALSEYGKELARYLTLFTVSMVALHHGWYMTSATFLGLFWHQIMFTAHDAGHLAITHIFAVDTLIGLFIADFCCGLSLGWWKSSHNVHHLVTNHPEHDPDIQNVPLFATCPSFFRSICSTYYDNFVFVWDAVADFLVPYQRYTYYPIMGIARFNLYLLSWLHVLSAKSSSLGRSKAWWIRPTEITFICCYLFLYGYCLVWCALPTWTIRIAFVLVSHIITMPLHVQITLSHWGMSTSDLGDAESFPQRQLRTTMDVDCPAWLDFIHGGLQFQAVHHLFPRVPRHNLRKAQVLVREFCEDVGIPYTILGFADGNRKVLGRLDEVSEQLKHLVECQKYMAETRESGLH